MTPSGLTIGTKTKSNALIQPLYTATPKNQEKKQKRITGPIKIILLTELLKKNYILYESFYETHWIFLLLFCEISIKLGQWLFKQSYIKIETKISYSSEF